MRILIGVDLVIDKELNLSPSVDVSNLYVGLRRCGHHLCLHKVSIYDIVRNYKPSDDILKRLFNSYEILEMSSITDSRINTYSSFNDTTEWELHDSILLNELVIGRVDALISEQPNLHYKAHLWGFENQVYSIDSFLEKLCVENPELMGSHGLSIKKTTFDEIDLNDSFFDGLKEDYPEFCQWFRKKGKDEVYITYDSNNRRLLSFLYLKVEYYDEDYSDITPVFERKKRLKIGTFKVISNGFRIGERFIKIVFDNAMKNQVQEIYVTLYNKRSEQRRLTKLLDIWGFKYWGKKRDELVYVRDFEPKFNIENLSHCYPFISTNNDSYLVPINPKYHNALFPEVNLKVQRCNNTIEKYLCQNGITRVFMSHELLTQPRQGDNLLFYRIGGSNRSVLSTLGVVQNVKSRFENGQSFIGFIGKSSPYSEAKLLTFWKKNEKKNTVIKFLYNLSFVRRIPMTDLIVKGIISKQNLETREITKITSEQVKTIFKLTDSDESIIVNKT